MPEAELIVQHSWLDEGKLGFNLMSRARGGVIVSVVNDPSLPIQQVCARNSVAVVIYCYATYAYAGPAARSNQRHGGGF